MKRISNDGLRTWLMGSGIRTTKEVEEKLAFYEDCKCSELQQVVTSLKHRAQQLCKIIDDIDIVVESRNPEMGVDDLNEQLMVYRDHRGYCDDCDAIVDLEYYNSECVPPSLMCTECGCNVYPRTPSTPADDKPCNTQCPHS